MENLAFIASGMLFAVLLSFLLLVFSVFLLSSAKSEKRSNFSPNVSVAIPAYNEAENIAGCIHSVLSQKYSGKIEVIVVDDGSTDNTYQIAKKFPVKVIKQENKGKSFALNLAAKKARHDFIVSVDADMVLEKNCIFELVSPMVDEKIGATTANCKVKNNKGMLGMFQNIEYHYNNLISNSFSKVLGQSMWFFGAVACYRKAALAKTNGFKKVLAEDMFISIELTSVGYKTKNVASAIGYTQVPSSFKELYHQRYRWAIGGLEAVVKNKGKIAKSRSASTHLLAFTQYFGAIYSLFALPLIAYQVYYWLPYNAQTILSLFLYLFRWFSMAGIFWVLGNMATMGIKYYTLLGISCGIISTAMILASLRMFKDKISLKNLAAIFFYFPYTIALNAIIAVSLIKAIAERLR